jgi:hypothetical protein
MAKHPVEMDGNLLSPQKEPSKLLKTQSPQIFEKQYFLISTEDTEYCGILTR